MDEANSLEGKCKNCEKTYSVYIHVFPDGKVYVGATRQSIKKRWRHGQGYRNQKNLFSAILNTGWENIRHIVVKDGLSEPEAQQLERDLIKQYHSQDPEHGYNTKNGGQVFGEHSEEFLKNLEDRMIGNTYCVGRKLSKEHIEALRMSRIGKHNPSPRKGLHDMSDEAKLHLSIKAKERWANDEMRKKYMSNRPDLSGSNNPRFGAKLTDETKEKIRQKALGRKVSEETKEKISLTIGKPVIQFDSDMVEICRYPSCKKAGEAVNGNGTNISFCCNNPSRTYRGFYWRHLEESGNKDVNKNDNRS